MSDLAETLHRASFHKSGRANATENQNFFFQSGFNIGAKHYPGIAPLLIIAESHAELASVMTEDQWKEWKRGLWASVIQKAASVS